MRLSRIKLIGDGEIMAVARYILMGCSVLMASALLLFWTITGRFTDFFLLFALAFLVTNAFYIFFTRPTLKTSDIIRKASTELAFASLKLHYRAQDAQNREHEAEVNHLEEVQIYQHKLQAAKDMLQHLGEKLPLNFGEKTNHLQISQQVAAKDVASPKQLTVSDAMDEARSATVGDSKAKQTTLNGATSLAPPTTLLK